MDRLILILGLILLAAFAVITWIGPRRYGLGGLIVVHLIGLATYFTFAGLSLYAGVYEYDGLLSLIGLATQVFILNGLLLPIGIIALWRRRRSMP